MAKADQCEQSATESNRIGEGPWRPSSQPIPLITS